MNSRCERCNGVLTVWDERVYLADFYSDVKAIVCHLCQNDIRRLISTHPRWAEVGVNSAHKTLVPNQTQGEVDVRGEEVNRKEDELRLFFHDYVRSLLPFQVKASENEEANRVRNEEVARGV